VEREYRVLSALHAVGFPVPRPLALCEDTAVLGATFYVMQVCPLPCNAYWRKVVRPGVGTPFLQPCAGESWLVHLL
jgi:hypothetical protein